MVSVETADAAVSFISSLFSLVGSCLIIASYSFARRQTKTNPKAARLIFYLSCSDCFWCTSSLAVSLFWLSECSVPNGLCFILGPIMLVCKTASILWTSVIGFDLLHSIKKRKWNIKGVKTWELRYFLYVYGLAVPAGIVSIVKEIRTHESFGCAVRFERLGDGWVVGPTVLLPIFLAYITNLGVYFLIRTSMSTAYPQSVRKRRRQLMYHYVIVCILCWTPTILHYALSIYVDTDQSGMSVLEVLARLTVLLSGFFNFVVYGLQDRHLNSALKIAIAAVGLGPCCLEEDESGALPKADEKTVMFDETTLVPGANISKHKKSVFYYNRLSTADKEYLYQQRPDLNMRAPLLAETEKELPKAEEEPQDAAPGKATVCGPLEDSDAYSSSSSDEDDGVVPRSSCSSPTQQSSSLHLDTLP